MIHLGKKKYISFNQLHNTTNVAKEGHYLEKIENFKYLGSWVSTTHTGVKPRKDMTCRALIQGKLIQKSLTHYA